MPRCRRATPPSSASCSVCSAREDACRLIKRCNDFGAGGVSVAIGELADGLDIDLNKVTKKYEGLDGTELAISESQERMAVAVAAEDAETFIAAAPPRKTWRLPSLPPSPRSRACAMCWNGKTIVDLSREFLNSNGAEQPRRRARPARGHVWQPQCAGATLSRRWSTWSPT